MGPVIALFAANGIATFVYLGAVLCTYETLNKGYNRLTLLFIVHW